jgi:hypothetical protein
MVLGEQLGGWVISKKVSVTQAAAVCLVGKHWGHQSNMPTAPSNQLPLE